jgi:TonB family protein
MMVASCVFAGCATRSAPQSTVILEADATVPPQIVRQGAIEVPPELNGRACTSGTAVVAVDVDASGRVAATRVTRASGEPAFDAACERSARRTEYRPATRGGKEIAGATAIECRLQCP